MLDAVGLLCRPIAGTHNYSDERNRRCAAFVRPSDCARGIAAQRRRVELSTSTL
jgi:hypothetical protein